MVDATFGDSPENLNVERSSTAVVPTSFAFLFTNDGSCPFRRHESDGYPGDNLMGIERGVDGFASTVFG